MLLAGQCDGLCAVLNAVLSWVWTWACIYVCAYIHEVMGVSSVCLCECVFEGVAVSQGHVDSPYTDSARGKRQPC